MGKKFGITSTQRMVTQGSITLKRNSTSKKKILKPKSEQWKSIRKYFFSYFVIRFDTNQLYSEADVFIDGATGLTTKSHCVQRQSRRQNNQAQRSNSWIISEWQLQEQHISTLSRWDSKPQSFNCASATSLIAYCEDATNTAGNTTGVTYNGVALTEIGRQSHPSDNRELTMWGVHNPSTGTNSLGQHEPLQQSVVLCLEQWLFLELIPELLFLPQQEVMLSKQNGSSTSSYGLSLLAMTEMITSQVSQKFISGGQASGTGSTLYFNLRYYFRLRSFHTSGRCKL